MTEGLGTTKGKLCAALSSSAALQSQLAHTFVGGTNRSTRAQLHSTLQYQILRLLPLVADAETASNPHNLQISENYCG